MTKSQVTATKRSVHQFAPDQKRGQGKKTPSELTDAGLLILLAFAAWAVWLGFQAWQQMHGWPRGLSRILFWKDFSFNETAFFTHVVIILKHSVILSAWALGAHGCGRWLLNAFFPGARSRLESLLLSLGLGWALFSFLLFWIGLAGGFTPWFLGFFWLATSTLGGWLTWQSRHEIMPLNGAKVIPELGWSEKVWVLIFAGLGLVAGVSTQAPEIFNDALVYHLAVPQAWLAEQRIHYMPHNFFSNLGMQMEVLYTVCLAIADERLCRLLHVSFSGLAGLTVFAIARRYFGQRAAFWAMALYSTVPLVVANSAVSGVDSSASFFTWLGCMILLEWSLGQSPAPQRLNVQAGRRLMLLAGMYWGAALASKYTAVIAIAPFFLAALMIRFRQPGKNRLPIQIIWLGLGTLLILLPWLAKSWVYTGNPVYPFLHSIIPSRGLDSQKANLLMQGLSEHKKISLAELALLPWAITFQPATGESYLGTVFLLLVPGFLWCFWHWRRGPPAIQILCFAGLGSALLWMLLTRIPRYYLAALPIWTMLGAWLLDTWQRQLPALGRLGRATVLVFAAWGCLHTLTLMGLGWDQIKAGLGQESRFAYLARRLVDNYYPMAEVINDLPEDSRIAFLGEVRGYYFKRRVVPVSRYDVQPLLRSLEKSASTEEVWQNLRQQGYTHLYVNGLEAAHNRDFEAETWSDGALARYQELCARYLKLLVLARGQQLYAILDQPLPELPIKFGRPLFSYPKSVVKEVAGYLWQHERALAAGRMELVYQLAKRITQIVPEWDEGYTQLAKTCLYLKKNGEALQAYQQADALGWLDAASYMHMANLAQAAGLFIADKYKRMAEQQPRELASVPLNLFWATPF